MKKIVLAFAVIACVSLVSCTGSCGRPHKGSPELTPQGVGSAPEDYNDDSEDVPTYDVAPMDSVTGNDSVTGGY